jgi:hypothetical protein
MTSPAKTRRENQPIPTTADAAAARFKCEAYLCTMDGAKCRDQHVHAAEFKPMHRDACIDCPAGEARAILLGKGAGGSGQAAICTAKTAKGGPCAHAPVEGGLCHIHRGAYAKKERTVKKTPQAPVKAAQKPAEPAQKAAPVKAPAPPPRPAEEPRTAVEKTERVQPKPPVPTPVAKPIPVAKPAPAPAPKPAPVVDARVEVEAICEREGCDRPAYSGARLSEYCKGCGASAYSTLRKLDQSRTPTDDERRAWLKVTPVQPQFRHPRAAAPAVVVEAAPLPPGKFAAKGVDWDKVDLGKRSDCEIARELGVSATAVRFQRQKRKIAAPVTPRPKGVRKVRKELGRAIVDAATATANAHVIEMATAPVDVHIEITVDQVEEPQHVEIHEVLQAAPVGEPVREAQPPAPEPAPADPNGGQRSLKDWCADMCNRLLAGSNPDLEFVWTEAPRPTTAPVDAPDHLVAVTFTLNRRAFAELERMAKAGLHGDDPCDAARTLVLDGLRRFALVRP